MIAAHASEEQELALMLEGAAALASAEKDWSGLMLFFHVRGAHALH